MILEIPSHSRERGMCHRKDGPFARFSKNKNGAVSQNCWPVSIRYKCGMNRLSESEWERIRDHFPGENILDGWPGRKPILTREVLQPCFGYSTPARNGTCCGGAIRTTKPCVGALRLGVTRFRAVFWWP